MGVLTELAPKNVFSIFEQICAIPHGSGNTAALGDWCVGFATRLGLKTYQDAAGNVVIDKPAAKGREGEAPILLQAHLDMVCAKTPDCTIDFMKDGITPQTDGKTVWAKATTLGADNGIGVAMILAVLQDDTLSHPPIEAVLTADEETGLIGAGQLDGSVLSSRRMLNLDSEDEGIFTCGCAGGSRTTVTLPLAREANTKPAFTIILHGFTGGHSGIEIHKNRGNANVVLGRFVKSLGDVRLASFVGGELENAIAKEATCVVVGDFTLAELTAKVKALQKELTSPEDANLDFSVATTTADTVWDAVSTNRILDYLSVAPNGIQEMNSHLPDAVETSLNLGVVTCKEDEISFIYALRSAVEAKRAALHEALVALGEQFGGSSTSAGVYPGWAYKEDSALRTTMEQVFQEQYGKEPVVEVIHAGLECGMFSEKCPGLDAVSLGPTMKDVHTPSERVWVDSVERVYEFLCRLLKAC